MIIVVQDAVHIVEALELVVDVIAKNRSLVVILQVQQWLKIQLRRLKDEFGIDVRSCLAV